ncbi:MAG: barstar family protein [Bacteroidota bacterium]
MEENKPLDYYILRDGSISMYHKQTFLSQDIHELEKIGYRIVDFNTSKWTKKTVHRHLKEGLDFPDYYGENLNAFDDCIWDLITSEKKGLVLVFRFFDEFVSLDKSYSEGLLDVLACQARSWLLHQKGLICLLHSSDPNLFFHKLGGLSPQWNRNEWVDIDRKN